MRSIIQIRRRRFYGLPLRFWVPWHSGSCCAGFPHGRLTYEKCCGGLQSAGPEQQLWRISNRALLGPVGRLYLLDSFANYRICVIGRKTTGM